MQRTTEWVSSLDDHDCQVLSTETLSFDNAEDVLPLWFTQMHLTETQVSDVEEDFSDHMMEIDHNFSAQCSTLDAIEYYKINEMPRPHFDPQPRRREKRGRDDWRNIQKITGNAPNAINPPRQSTTNDSPCSQSTPKVNRSSKKLTQRPHFDI